MLVVSSIPDLNLAAKHCDRLIMLKDGRIVAAGGRDVLTPRNIRKVYGIDVEVIHHDGSDIIVPV
jgi:iron complex transport system ATP-binding protein